jgi:hypothetical protein
MLDEASVSVRCECLRVNAVEKGGRLLGLADVRIEVSGVEIEINAVRIEREATGVSVRLPIDRNGRAIVTLPEEVKGPLADTVLAAGLEAGFLRELAGHG